MNYNYFYRNQLCPADLLGMLLDLAKKADHELRKYSGNLSTYAKTQAAWQNLKSAILPITIQEFDEYLWSESEQEKI